MRTTSAFTTTTNIKAVIVILFYCMITLTNGSGVIQLGGQNEAEIQARCKIYAQHVCKDKHKQSKYFKCCNKYMIDCIHMESSIRLTASKDYCHLETSYEEFCYEGICRTVAFDVYVCELI